MRIPSLFEIDLHWYYSSGIGHFYHSSQGAQLERARAFRYTSSGKAIAIPDKANSWFFVHVPPEDRNPSVEIDYTTLDRFGRISRRMLAYERVDPFAARLVEVYYGDEGARWAHQPAPGRLMCLYPHTASGQRYLMMQGPVEGLRDSERLANVELLYKQSGKYQELVRAMRREAGELLVRMWKAWSDSEPNAA